MRNIDAEARIDRTNRRVGEFIQALTDGRGASGLEDGRVTRVTVRLPTLEDPEALLVVKAVDSDGEWVAFVGGMDLTQALLVWAAKDGQKGLKWREDVPWEQRIG